MSGLQSPTTLQALKTSIYKDFQAAMTEIPVRSDEIGLFSKVSSSTAMNTYAWLAAIPHMRKWIGPRAVIGLAERVYQILNEDFERTIGVKKNDIDDGNVANVQLVMQGLSQAARKLPDDLAVSLLQNGHLSSATGYDGQNFFDTDHPTDIDNVTGTQSNYLTSTALNAGNLQLARSTMMSYKGENGQPIGAVGRVLLVPPALEKTALETASAPFLAGGATNVQAQMGFRVVVWEALAGQDTTWYLIDDVSPGPRALILQERQAPKLISKTDDKEDRVFWNKEYIWGVDARYGAGYGVWFKALKAVA